jgi:hypothetical protein
MLRSSALKRTGFLQRHTPLSAVSKTNSRPTNQHTPYVAWIRTLPCAVCNGAHGRSQASHTKVLGRGTRRSTNRSCIPLCGHCHLQADDSYHALTPESRWADYHGLDLPELVHRLNGVYDLMRDAKRNRRPLPDPAVLDVDFEQLMEELQ